MSFLKRQKKHNDDCLNRNEKSHEFQAKLLVDRRSTNRYYKMDRWNNLKI